MKVLIIDQDGTGLSFALRASVAGHSVRWFVRPKSNSNALGGGFKGVEKIDNWVASAGWADLIFSTGNSDYLEKLEFFSKRGHPVFAATPASVRLQTNALESIQSLVDAGVDSAPYSIFPTMQAAERHVIKTNERYVFKSIGDEEGSPRTYVSQSPADLVAWLRRTAPPKGGVMLQQIVDGVKLRVTRFMGSTGWVGPYNESFTYPAGTVISYFTPSSKLGNSTLDKLADALLARGHRGAVTLSCVVDAAGKPWPTAVTCGLSWPTANVMLGATRGDPIRWMRDALDGKDTATFTTDIGCGVSLSHSDGAGVPIYGVTRGVAVHVHPQAVQMLRLPDTAKDGKGIVERDMWATAGSLVAVVDGFGSTVKQATKRAYGTVDKLYVAGGAAHRAVGDVLQHHLPKLHALGYATHCNYGTA